MNASPEPDFWTKEVVGIDGNLIVDENGQRFATLEFRGRKYFAILRNKGIILKGHRRYHDITVRLGPAIEDMK